MYSFFCSLFSKYFYYLSLIKNKDGSWSIHGLWPQYSFSSYPSYCKKKEFDPRALDPIRKELEEKWHSYEKDKDDEFWKHEWEKHGSCMFTEMTELEYFQKTLELFNAAIQTNLPTEHEADGKCLIPVDLQFKFIEN